MKDNKTIRNILIFVGGLVVGILLSTLFNVMAPF